MECHIQPSLNVAITMFGLVFVMFRKLKSLYRGNRLNLRET